MLRAHVNLDLVKMKRFQRAFNTDLRTANNSPIRKALKQWGARYRGFAQERFDTFSKGGGDWAPLAESTTARRRKGRSKKKAKVKHAILRDTGTLFAALAPTFSGKPGAIEQDIPFGIRVGYGGPVQHSKGRITIAGIAAAHQAGSNRLPQRKIIVEPPQNVISAMASDMRRALNEMSK